MDEFKRHWWSLEENEASDCAISTYQKIRGAQSHRFLHFDKLSQAYNARSSLSGARPNRSTKNLCKGIVDYCVSKIATKKIKLRYLTDGATEYASKKQAKQLEELAGGLHYTTQFWPKVKHIYRDACIFGTGIMKHVVTDDGITVERVLPSELWAPEEECTYGLPRQLFQIRTVSRSVAAAEFGSGDAVALADRIDAERNLDYESSETSDLIDLLECWHLPSGGSASDGKHIIATSYGILFEEEYDLSYFPFTFFMWAPGVTGIDGIGLVEELFNIQAEMNFLQEKVKEEMELGATRLFVRAGEKLNKSQVSNVPGSVIEYENTIPSFQNADMTNKETWNRIEYLEAAAYRDTGVSELGAAAKRVPGITSGVGLREMYDQTSERHMLQGQLFEESVIDATRKLIELSQTVDNLELRLPKNGVMKKIKVSDKLVSSAQFEIEAFPSNLLPHLPAARLEQVKESIQAGLFTNEEGLELLDFPDIKALADLKNAPRRVLETILDKIVEDQEFIPCEPFFNVDLAINMASLRYQRAITQNAPEVVLQLLRDFIESAEHVQQERAIAAQAQMMNEQAAVPPGPAPAAPPALPEPQMV